MESIPIPRLPGWPDLVTGCGRLARALPTLVLPDHSLTILHLRPYQMAPGWSIRPHEHSFYEASLILEGRAVTDTPTLQTLTPGHVFFHGPHTPHHWGAPTDTCLRLIVGFTVEPPIPVVAPAHWPWWPDLLYEAACLFELASAQTPGWRDLASARLATILARALTLGSLPPPHREVADAPDEFVCRIDAFLTDNRHHPLRLEDIAASQGISVSSLSHRYRHLTGSTVGQRLLGVRMEHAAHLLTTTDLSLPAICDRVGLTDAAYLCRLFKRYFRATPGEYRRR